MINMTNSEKRAALILVIVLLVSVIIQWLLPHETRPDIFDYSLQDSLFMAISNDTLKKDNSDTTRNEKQTDKKPSKKFHSIKKELQPKSININTAGYEQLTRLPRIGKVTATNILEYRDQHGPFKTLQELTNVKRIGPKTLDKISPFIYIKTDTTGNL